MTMDTPIPQQRRQLEQLANEAWEALEAAGTKPTAAASSSKGLSFHKTRIVRYARRSVRALTRRGGGVVQQRRPKEQCLASKRRRRQRRGRRHGRRRRRDPQAALRGRPSRAQADHPVRTRPHLESARRPRRSATPRRMPQPRHCPPILPSVSPSFPTRFVRWSRNNPPQVTPPHKNWDSRGCSRGWRISHTSGHARWKPRH